jgi:esterase/lipase
MADMHALRLRLTWALLATMAGAWLLAGCAAMPDSIQSVGTMTFAEHQREAVAQMRSRRHFQTQDREAELAWNGPGEWRPASVGARVPPAKGILLVHGLGDSPWSFHDLAPELAAQGFLVRTVLLPGHGTHPDDLVDVTFEQWRQVVHEQVAAMLRDIAGPVYLGGFSTGANLVLEAAYANPKIAGLLLFSPGFRTSVPLGWLAPLIARVRPWIVKPSEEVALQNPVRYMATPTNGFAQFYRSARAAQQLLNERTYDKPVFMAVAEHDSVIDTAYLLDVFLHRFTNPDSRLVWYGRSPAGLTDHARVFVRDDKVPQDRISQFSHMGLLFSPANPLYGARGNVRICLNGFDGEARRACEKGAQVWYSDWGYREEGKIHARLTFNPYYGWQTAVMATVLDPAPSCNACASAEAAGPLRNP